MSKAVTFGSDGAFSRTGGNGGFRNVLSEVLGAVSSAREAQAEYKRQLSRGADPSDAVKAAFAKLDG